MSRYSMCISLFAPQKTETKQNNFPNKPHNSQLIQTPYGSFDFRDQGVFFKEKTLQIHNRLKPPPGEDAQHVSQDPH